jgi:hypothetical protein
MRIDALPPAHEIDSPEIRQAAEQYEAAQQQLRARQQAAKDLEPDSASEKSARQHAIALDAQAAEEAMAAGKSAPKRNHLAAHAKLVEDAPYELKVAQLAAQRARADLEAVLDEHGAAWAESLAIKSENLEQAWNEGMAALIALHGERVALGARLRKLGADVPDLGRIRLKPAQLIDSLNGEKLQLAYYPSGPDRHAHRAVVNAADVLAALAELGVVEELAPVGNSQLGEAVQLAALQKKIVERGVPYTDEELKRAHERIATSRLSPQPGVTLVARGGRVTTPGGQAASVYVPGSEGDDDR